MNCRSHVDRGTYLGACVQVDPDELVNGAVDAHGSPKVAGGRIERQAVDITETAWTDRNERTEVRTWGQIKLAKLASISGEQSVGGIMERNGLDKLRAGS